MKYSYQSIFESVLVTLNKGCLASEDKDLSNILRILDSLTYSIFISSMFLLELPGCA
jgi:hypothetical protein